MDKALSLALPATLATLGVGIAQAVGFKSVWVQLIASIALAGVGIAVAGIPGKKSA